MNYSISRNKNAIIWSFIIAAICIALFSKSSPFYPINDWVDAQCFFTVGKSMMKGMIPYKDIFEQKGPLLYFIYGIASLISFDSFLGVYFIEVAAFASFLYLSYRVISLYIETAYALCVLPAYAVAMCVTSAFSQGGSAEELCLPLFMLAIYTMLKYCREDCSTVMDSKVVIGMGFAAGLVFWIKFTLLGIFFSWMAFLFFVTWKKYDIKTGMKLCALFLSGMFLATVPWLLYFGYHNALTDLLEVYFYNNLFLYSEQVSFFNKLRFLMENIFVVAGNNKVLALLGLLGIGIVFDKNISKQEKLFLAGSILSAYLFIYLGGRILPYYPLPLFCFCVFGSVFLFKIIQKSKIALLMKRYFSVVILFVSVLSIGYGIGESCNMYLFIQ